MGRASRKRIWSRAIVAVTTSLLVLLSGVGWYVSGEIIDGFRVVDHRVVYDTDVLAVATDEITVRVSAEPWAQSDRDAVMGLRWDGGYGQVGPAIHATGDVETRPFVLVTGTAPPIGSNVADFDSFAFPTDPGDLGLDFERVKYSIPGGEVESWFLPGEGSTWIVAVHGRAADRREYLRLAAATRNLGYPLLIIRYHNDPGAPTTPGSLILMGQDEWRDVQAGVDWALAHGATDVVLYGASLGGALTLGYTLEEDRDVVRALILEAPAADLREIVGLRSGEALPIGGPIGDAILGAGRLITWARTGLDFDTVDYVDRSPDLTVPILLLHGDEDTTVPIEVGRNLADARPDLVELHEIAGGEHVRAWNEDPIEYASVVGDFLSRVGRSTAGADRT